MLNHLGRNPQFPAGTTSTSSSYSDPQELIPINEALHSSFKKLIQARLRAMNKTNNSWPVGVELPNQNINEASLMSTSADDQPEMRAMIGQQAITISLTVFGNLLMIFVILRNNYVLRRKRITPVQLLMLHMCTSDLLFALVTIFPTMIMTLTVPNFYGPNVLCKLVKFLQVLPMYTSSFLLVAISADRFYAICRPLANIRSGRYNRPVLYAAIAWITAFIFSMPQLVIFGKNEGSNDCVGLYSAQWQYAIYVIMFNVIAWLLPSIIAGSLYFCVCQAVWKSMAFDKNCMTPARGNSFSTKTKVRSASSYTNDAEHQHLTATLTGDRRDSRLSSVNTLVHHSGLRIQREELDRKRVQTVKLTLTIVCTNFVLWSPFCIISIIDALAPAFLSPIFATYVMFFGNLNSSVNPFIWFFFNWDMVKVAVSPFIVFDERKLQKERSHVYDSTFGLGPNFTNNGTTTSPNLQRPSPLATTNSYPSAQQRNSYSPKAKPAHLHLRQNGHSNSLASPTCKPEPASMSISHQHNNNNRLSAYRPIPNSAISPTNNNNKVEQFKDVNECNGSQKERHLSLEERPTWGI